MVVAKHVGRRRHGFAKDRDQAFGTNELVEHRNARAEGDLHGADQEHQAANDQPEFAGRKSFVGIASRQAAPASQEQNEATDREKSE